MKSVRRQLMHHRVLCIWLIAMALAMKALVPSGFMPSFSAGAITIELCGGHGVQEVSLPGKDHGPEQGQSKAEAPCAFSGLAVPGLAGADPIQLVAAIFFIMAMALLLQPLPARTRSSFLRPPLRGPPGTA